MANLTKSKKWVILAVAIILMPFVENILGIRQLLTAYAEDVVSGEVLVDDPDGRVTVEKSDEHEADGNMVWTLTVHKENAENETSKVKVSLADDTVVQGVTIAGEGFQASGSTLVENDYTNDKRVLTVTAPVGVTANLTVDYDLRQEIMPASKMDGEEGEKDETGAGEPAQPVTEITENVIAAGQSDAGNIQLNTPAEVLQAIADAEAAAAQAEADAKAAAQAEADAKAAAQAEADAKAAAQAEVDAKAAAKAAAEAATAQAAAEAEKDKTTKDEPDTKDGVATVTNFQVANYRMPSTTKIETNRKDAKIANWHDRTYDITLTGEVTSQVEQKPADIVLVLDVSGSMDDPSGTIEKSRLQLMQDAATDLIEQLGDRSPTSRVGVVTFADSGSKLYDFTTMTTDNVTKINHTIDNDLSADGSTSADEGMKLAYEMIRDRSDSSRPVYVMFLTDGVPTTQSSFSNAVASRAESYRSLIMGETADYTGLLWGETKKGTYDSANLGIGFSQTSRGVIVTDTVHPLTFATDMQPTIYSVLQLNDYPETAAETFMNYMKAGEKGKSLKSDSEEGLSDIFDDFLNTALGLSMKDTLDPRFEITEEGKTQIATQKGSISVVDGKTVVTFPLKSNTFQSYTFEVKAVDGYVGENAVPTNIPSESGIMIENNLTEFVVGDGSKNISSPYVNVKLKDLKAVNTTEPQINAGEAARSSETIRGDWTSGTELIPSDGTNANDYDPVLGSYPEVSVSGPENYEAYPTATKHYTGIATATANYATEDTAAQAYADDEGQGSDEEAQGLADDNNTVANLTHTTPVKAVPTITGNSKSAHLVNWDDRVYQVDLTAKVEFSQNTADPLVLLVLDASGSMISNDMGNKTRLAVMKDVATGLVTNLSTQVPSADVGVIRFSSGNNTQILSQFVPVKDNSSTINQAINNITTGSYQYTRADDGFKLAYQMLSAYKDTNRPVYIMYLTDGVPTLDSGSFNNEVASKAQSYRSLILGKVKEYGNPKVEKGEYDSGNLGVNTSYGISTASSPSLNISNTTIYSVLQADGYSGNQGKPYMDFMASDLDKSVKASSADDLKDVFADFLQEIVSASLVDVVDPHFELTAESKAALIAAGATVSEYSSVNGTTITWNGIPLNETVTKNFQIKAIDSYVGENVVPTNIPGESGINVNGSLTQFDIYDGDNKTDLDTPYVNVKLKPFIGAKTSETIWLGQNAKAKGEPTSTTAGEIYGDWRDGVDYGGFASDYPTIVFDDELNATDSKGYEEKPEVDKVYSETGTATAKTLTSSDAAKAYADGYAFTHLSNEIGQVKDNFTTGDFKHTVSIKTGEVSFDKYLEGAIIPDTVEDFNPEFTVSTTSINTQADFEYQNNKLSLTNLGVGVYEITEKEPKGISNAEWVLEVAASPDNSELTYTLKSGEDEVTFLNNEWNDFQININKKDGNDKDLVGAEFTLFDSNGEEIEVITSTDDTPLSLFSFTGLAPGSYTIEETKTPDGHVGLKAPIEVVINADGRVTIDGQDEEWVVDDNNNVISIIATNQAKGVLPATGGSGRQMVSFVILLMTMCLAGVGIIYVAYTRKGGV